MIRVFYFREVLGIWLFARAEQYSSEQFSKLDLRNQKVEVFEV